MRLPFLSCGQLRATAEQHRREVHRIAYVCASRSTGAQKVYYLTMATSTVMWGRAPSGSFSFDHYFGANGEVRVHRRHRPPSPGTPPALLCVRRSHATALPFAPGPGRVIAQKLHALDATYDFGQHHAYLKSVGLKNDQNLFGHNPGVVRMQTGSNSPRAIHIYTRSIYI